jgi:glyoxylase-like metal-dependent hydrolase (beta-lactamase superfamily II)
MTVVDPLAGVQVFERGWLSSNNVLIHAAPGEAGAWLIDSSHVNHAAQTVDLLRHALAGRPAPGLAGVANTHLHSDHCGGNQQVQEAFGAPILIPPGQAEAVQAWDEAALSYQATRQRMRPFRHQGLLTPGDALVAGGREWSVMAAAGHDPHMVMLFDRRHGVLISADALWENGFGIVFPEIEGEPGFDDVAAALDQVAALQPRLVIPGHGAPFADVPAALARARGRLAAFRADPRRHLRHAVKVLLKYHLMEERRQSLAEAQSWALAMPLFQESWQRLGHAGTPEAWTTELLGELIAAGALRRDGAMLYDV